jgi:23S rRNA (uracil1939-C5)-methyltransferase
MPDRGDDFELSIEKPAAGGRMLARHDGKVIFVHGAIPGERVRVRLERVERQLAFASVTEILESSPDRRQHDTDLWCGGCSYAHIVYPRQLALKAELIREAFARLGRVPLDGDVAVQASPERGYRLKARFHVSSGRVGFYRESTHELCDAATTGQLREDSLAAAIASVEAALAIAPVVAAELSENIAAAERVVHLEGSAGDTIPSRALEAAMSAGKLTGCSSGFAGEGRAVGIPVVTDPMSVLTKGRATSGRLQRHAESFFQANRYLLADLLATVLAAVPPERGVVDLYAGVGLFSISLARLGRERIVAVEGNRTSVKDLMANASECGRAVRIVFSSVEDFLSSSQPDADAIIVDPPRTGMSRAAMQAVIRAAADRVIYVSCDPPTLARDARRLLDSGYRLSSLRAFDLFPNTPHVETVVIFDRG